MSDNGADSRTLPADEPDHEIERKGLSDLTGTIDRRGEVDKPPTSGE